jgi:hypothetical protein
MSEAANWAAGNADTSAAVAEMARIASDFIVIFGYCSHFKSTIEVEVRECKSSEKFEPDGLMHFSNASWLDLYINSLSERWQRYFLIQKGQGIKGKEKDDTSSLHAI